METTLRHPQIINGEMQPRNFFIGLESVRRLNDMRTAFQAEGINLMSIPMIKRVEQGIRDEDLEPGTVIGVSPPINENDLINVLVWDGYSIAAISFINFHRKERNGWDVFNNNQHTVKPIDLTEQKPKKKKKKRTTPKHEIKRKIKARNGRRV